MKTRNPPNSATTGRLIFSVADAAAASASESSCSRRLAARAVRVARTRAPSLPASYRAAASSDRAGTSASTPSWPRVCQGGTRASWAAWMACCRRRWPQVVGLVGGVAQGLLDAGAAGQPDHDQVEHAGQGGAQLAAAPCRLGPQGVLGKEETASGQQHRRPRRGDDADVDASDGEDGGHRQGQEQPEAGGGGLFGEVPGRVAFADGQIRPGARTRQARAG